MDTECRELEEVAPYALETWSTYKDVQVIRAERRDQVFNVIFTHAQDGDQPGRKHRPVVTLPVPHATARSWLSAATRPTVAQVAVGALGWNKARARQVLGVTDTGLARVLEARPEDADLRDKLAYQVLAANIDHAVARLLWAKQKLEVATR